MLRSQLKSKISHNYQAYLFSYKNYGNTLIKLSNFYSIQKSNYDEKGIKNSGNKFHSYIQFFRKNGHYFANLDPLGLNKIDDKIPSPLDFQISYQDEIDALTKQQIHNSDIVTVQDLENYLKFNYISSVGIEFNHVNNPLEKEWLYKNYEKFVSQPITSSERTNIHSLLIQGEAVDHYLHKKFTTFKRYAGEGGEGALVALRAIYAYASETGVTDIVQCMAHRGRFVQMAILLEYSPTQIFQKIQGKNNLPKEYTTGTDDVVHHLSSSHKRRFPGAGCKDQDITISVVHNPSHLEAANPVSQGKTRAKQDDINSEMKVLNLQIHGDAAFSGQGIVYEALQMNLTPNYQIGGTVHVVLNNQIGYTTNIHDDRGTRYCTDIGKGFGIPVIHINSEDVETVHRVSKFLVAYRNQFKKDIILDLITYRRYGHNEVDEPEFTQPLMYDKIRKHQVPLPKKYSQELQQKGIVKEGDAQKIIDRVFKYLDQEFTNSSSFVQTLQTVTDENSKGSKAFTGKWKGMQFSQFALHEHYLKNTGLDIGQLKSYALQIHKYLVNLQSQSVTIKPSFTVHPRISKYFIDDRLDQIKSGVFDWATGESMAVSSLLNEGYNVRLSGQDVERGTFSQRHMIFTDQKTEEKWNPTKEFFSARNLGRLQVANSLLSEAAVMAYDFGYSMENPRNLVIWEAQFGDFYNTGQFIVDTFITCSEEKWMRQGSLVMMLPHGFDGAGPEHSSSRIERWLQMGTDLPVNFQLCVPTTPANVFHMLRRQMLRSYRKPLIVASAKSMLKQKQVKSNFSDIAEGTQFEPLIVRHSSTTPKATFICSGKISYEIMNLLNDKNLSQYNLLVLEELLPFPLEQVKQQLEQQSTPIYWVQEEPQNAGAYRWVMRYFNALGKDVGYIGRPSLATVAIGHSQQHSLEIQNIYNQILSIIDI